MIRLVKPVLFSMAAVLVATASYAGEEKPHESGNIYGTIAGDIFLVIPVKLDVGAGWQSANQIIEVEGTVGVHSFAMLGGHRPEVVMTTERARFRLAPISDGTWYVEFEAAQGHSHQQDPAAFRSFVGVGVGRFGKRNQLSVNIQKVKVNPSSTYPDQKEVYLPLVRYTHKFGGRNLK